MPYPDQLRNSVGSGGLIVGLDIDVHADANPFNFQ